MRQAGNFCLALFLDVLDGRWDMKIDVSGVPVYTTIAYFGFKRPFCFRYRYVWKSRLRQKNCLLLGR